MPGIPFWDQRADSVFLDDLSGENPWDTLVVAGEKLPGKVTPRGKLRKGCDIKKPKGGKGATINYTGDQPAKINLTWQIWTPQQWASAQKFMAVLQPRKDDAYPEPLAVLHPALLELGILNVFVEEISIIEIDEHGIGERVLEVYEWFPQAKQVKAQKKNPKTGGLGTARTILPGEYGPPLPPPAPSSMSPYQLFPPGFTRAR